MEATEFLNLFESCWFQLEILKTKTKFSPSFIVSSTPDDDFKKQTWKPEITTLRLPTITRSLSTDQWSSMTSFKVDSPEMPKLNTILSGEESTENSQAKQKEELPTNRVSRRRRTKSESKSLTQLEFEELKGFIDLGFVFSEEDKDPILASLIPGLQRLNKKNGENHDFDQSAIRRPYLSESWEIPIQDMREEDNPLTNWRVPALDNEIVMKDSLKWWAHTVASTVR